MTVTAQPELVRISILGAGTQVDVALPATAPIVALVPDLLALLRLPPPPGDDPEAIAALPRWTLARVGDAPFPAELSLAEAGVLAGELLVLHEDLPSAPGALVDDVVDGLAHLAPRHGPGWTSDDARRLGYAACVAASLVPVIAGRLPDAPRSAVLPIAAATAVLGLLAAFIGHRLRCDPRSLATVSVCTVLAAGLAGSLVPPPESPAAALATGGACALAAALIVHRCTGVAPRLHAFGGTAAALTTATGLAAMAWHGGLTGAAPITAALGVATVLMSARLAIAAGRLPLPPVPAVPPPPAPALAETGLEGIDAVPRDPADDALGAIADLALVDLRDLERRSAVATAYLTGIVTGAVTATVLAVAATALTHRGSSAALAYCAAVAVAFLARGRTHADRVQSAALIVGGLCCLGAVLVAAQSAVAVFLGGLGIAAASFVIGVAAPSHVFSPLQRRGMEVAEYAAIAAVIPLLLQLLDAYRAIRGF